MAKHPSKTLTKEVPVLVRMTRREHRQFARLAGRQEKRVPEWLRNLGHKEVDRLGRLRRTRRKAA